MSLSKRDTFVRYIDPLETMWEDAEGNLHFSVDNTLRAFELPDTPENREFVKQSFREMIAQADAERKTTTVIEDRAAPDSPDYWKTIPPEVKARCDHKFMGTKHCVKCGWEPDFQGGPMGGA